MSAAAITCAISPPMTPAPTTAALNTNMPPTLASCVAARSCQLHIRRAARRAKPARLRCASE